jgi:hypothetical protein
MNDGKITGFESDEDNIDDDVVKYGLSTTMSLVSEEFLSDRKITEADSIVATLTPVDPDTPIDIKLDTQLLGSISSGSSLSSPAAFPLEIDENAKAGTYNLKLNLQYRYQRDSAVDPPYGDYYYWYEDAAQTVILQIVIEDEPYFKVVSTEANLTAGGGGLVNVTIENTGDTVAYESIARISVVDPFTTTDDQAYLGDLKPGESASALFKVNVEDDATPKNYSIDTEVKYKDEDDDTQYSNDMKAGVEVGPAASIGDIISGNVLPIAAVVLICVFGGVVYFYKKRKNVTE